MVSEEIETYRKKLRELYASRKETLSRKIENYVLFETILKIIEKYKDKFRSLINRLKQKGYTNIKYIYRR